LAATCPTSNDKNVYAQTLDTYAGSDSAALLAATGGLPDITFRQTALRLFGKYQVDKQGTLGFSLIFAQVMSNDWAWNSQRNAVCLLGQYELEHQTNPDTDLPWGDLHLQVLTRARLIPGPGAARRCRGCFFA
jgi:hypothetical protein